MSKTITLALKKSLILEAAKADTFQSGQVDKSVDPIKNASLAFNSQAGDETYQERKLIRFLRSGLAKFAAVMNEFVDSEEGSLKYSLTDGSDNIDMVIVVSDRYNDGLAQPLSSIAEEYITYIVDFMWWQPIKPALAKDYASYAEDAITYIRLCLAKTAPKASEASYTDVTGYVNRAEGTTVVAATVTYDGEATGWKILASLLVDNFVTHNNLRYLCSDPSASFTLKVAGETEPVISGLADRHSFTANEIMAIQSAVGGDLTRYIVLVPQGTTGTSNVITVSYTTE